VIDKRKRRRRGVVAKCPCPNKREDERFSQNLDQALGGGEGRGAEIGRGRPA